MPEPWQNFLGALLQMTGGAVGGVNQALAVKAVGGAPAPAARSPVATEPQRQALVGAMAPAAGQAVPNAQFQSQATMGDKATWDKALGLWGEDGRTGRASPMPRAGRVSPASADAVRRFGQYIPGTPQLGSPERLETGANLADVRPPPRPAAPMGPSKPSAAVPFNALARERTTPQAEKIVRPPSTNQGWADETINRETQRMRRAFELLMQRSQDLDQGAQYNATEMF